jgi:hypothetical protein
MSGVRLGDVVDDEPGAVALTCVALGWRVFPLMPGRGTPAIRDWPKRATTDRNTVEEWWSWSFIGAGVGIATGRASGIWVLDIDVKNGVNGYDTWADLVTDHGPIPRTFTATSRSGGGHIYFRWPEHEVVRNSTGRNPRGVGLGLDVRGEGGYVRAPLRSSAVVDSSHPVDAPDWLLKRAVEATRAEGGGEGARAARSASRPVEWTDTRDALRFSAARLAAVDEGGRNDALNRASFLLARWSRETGVTHELAWQAMRWACRKNGLWESDGPEGCAATFNSGWNAGASAAG